VVGIVSFILRDSQGISFALPMDRAIIRFGEHLTMKRSPQRGGGNGAGTPSAKVREMPSGPVAAGHDGSPR
jgi:hypothetical protein